MQEIESNLDKIENSLGNIKQKFAENFKKTRKCENQNDQNAIINNM
jgi:hypothetical protein